VGSKSRGECGSQVPRVIMIPLLAWGLKSGSKVNGIPYVLEGLLVQCGPFQLSGTPVPAESMRIP